MKPCLADANIVLPLLVPAHIHHARVRQWFDGLDAGEFALCRFVQLAALRLLCNRAVMGDRAISGSAAVGIVSELLEDERVNFMHEPKGLDQVLPGLFRHAAPTSQLAADVYLAAFAISGEMRLVTIDRGFRQFRGLDLVLLEE